MRPPARRKRSVANGGLSLAFLDIMCATISIMLVVITTRSALERSQDPPLQTDMMLGVVSTGEILAADQGSLIALSFDQVDKLIAAATAGVSPNYLRVEITFSGEALEQRELFASWLYRLQRSASVPFEIAWRPKASDDATRLWLISGFEAPPYAGVAPTAPAASQRNGHER